ncbi:phenylacetate--CoA ligase family protein [Candidatus Kaiserbacteria bacterium]|nr:phenylacetate--CoA ligase family protein [Candidatus Kaiserbacteria bacterium]
MLSFEELRVLLERCTETSGVSFYRNLYGMAPESPARTIRDLDDWTSLPFVTKDALIASPLRERLFIPLSEVDHLRTSSGTSGKPPLFSPRTFLRNMEYRFTYHDFKKPILSYTVPAMPHWHQHVQESHGFPARVVTFDPKNAEACVRLAKAAGADSMSLFAFHIPLVAEHMKRHGIAHRIRFIEIAGEACTKLLFEFMRETFPNATILPFYGSSEVEDCPIGMPCRPITGEEPLSVYHAKRSHYHELVDPDTLAPVQVISGAEGELVITAYPGEPSSFPLIRYRTGDIVRVVGDHCEQHGTWSFTVLGRVGMDFLKVPGGVLRADEIERVLRTMPERVSDRFELHCSEEKTLTGPKLKPILHVEIRGEVDLTTLAQDIARNLRVAPSFTYNDGVGKGRYLPLVCAPLGTSTHGKTRRLSMH